MVVEKFVPSLESLCSLGLEGRSLGCPGKFAGTSRSPVVVRKVRAGKVRVLFSVRDSRVGVLNVREAPDTCNI